ncbi:MAG: hypothetical protein BWY82_00226 [Verrucomicrobia bacterium ADurb.Bin474]|nr:MAG: hypothetical protein BWY82_00226 [Verrucomicrobia bacterium ADurb.Bin474]
MRILGHEEDPEFEGAVFGVESADQVGFRFSHVKGGTVGFSKQGNKEEQCGERLQVDKPVGLLEHHDVGDAQSFSAAGHVCPEEHG